MRTRWYAVCYPSVLLTSINNAMRVEECATHREALERIREWQKEYPGKRFTVRREVSIEGETP